MNRRDRVALVAVAERVAAEAAALARRRSIEGVSVLHTKSSPEDIVTAVDREIESVIRSALVAERPGDGFLGEESGREASRTGITWVVDPIDGTVNFLYGIPQYAVSIAAVPDDGLDAADALAGVVVNPASGETFSAIAGGGARLNGDPIFVSRATSLRMALVDTGFSYRADERAVQARVMADLITSVRDVRRLGAASLDLCAVAAGRVDAYFEDHLNSWDIAAGVLIAREAGAVVTGFDGDRDLTRSVVAAEPDIHAELSRKIRRLYKIVE